MEMELPWPYGASRKAAFPLLPDTSAGPASENHRHSKWVPQRLELAGYKLGNRRAGWVRLLNEEGAGGERLIVSPFGYDMALKNSSLLSGEYTRDQAHADCVKGTIGTGRDWGQLPSRS